MNDFENPFYDLYLHLIWIFSDWKLSLEYSQTSEADGHGRSELGNCSSPTEN